MTKRESCRGCILSMGVTIELQGQRNAGGGGGEGTGGEGAGGLSSFVLLNAHTIILL